MASYGTKEGFDLKSFLNSLPHSPKLIVLDLDYTCWPTHVDCMVSSPFRSDGKGSAYDSYGLHIGLFPHVKEIITEIQSCNIPLAACSSTTDPDTSYQLQTVLGIKDKFSYSEVYPRKKTVHFKRIQEASGIAYQNMIFYDDDYTNIRDVSPLGVTCVYIEDSNGLTWNLFKSGLTLHAQKFNK